MLSVRVTGAAEAAGDLRDLGGDLPDAAGALDTLTDRGVHLVSSYAPRRTGDLASSFRADLAGDGGGTGDGEDRAVLSDLVYAGVINYGWPAHNIAPARFVERAAEQLEQEATGVAEQAIASAIRERGMD